MVRYLKFTSIGFSTFLVLGWCCQIAFAQVPTDPVFEGADSNSSEISGPSIFDELNEKLEAANTLFQAIDLTEGEIHYHSSSSETDEPLKVYGNDEVENDDSYYLYLGDFVPVTVGDHYHFNIERGQYCKAKAEFAGAGLVDSSVYKKDGPYCSCVTNINDFCKSRFEVLAKIYSDNMDQPTPVTVKIQCAIKKLKCPDKVAGFYDCQPAFCRETDILPQPGIC